MPVSHSFKYLLTSYRVQALCGKSCSAQEGAISGTACVGVFSKKASEGHVQVKVRGGANEHT